VPGSEKYCGACGSALERATPELWFRKCVEPELAKDPSKLLTGRPAFFETAWRLQLTKEEAAAKLEAYRAAPDQGRREEAAARGTHGGEFGRASPPKLSAGSPDGAGFLIEPHGLTANQPADGPGGETAERVVPAAEREPRRKTPLGISPVVIIACLAVAALSVAAIILLARRGAPGEKAIERGSPSPATPTPLTTPTPPPMVEIGGGEFVMGRDAAEGGDRYESPSHPVTVGPFLMDVYEVTREEYQRCVEGGKCAQPPGWGGDSYPAGTGRLPVTGVTWEDANSYALWAGKSLPTEEQWEFAARGGGRRLYPWGDEWAAGRANLGGDRLAEVGSHGESSPFGLFDMIGNAQEWTRSEWKKYPDKSAYLSGGVAANVLRVIRGGSYKDAPGVVTATYRNALRMKTEPSYAQTGFRCVREIGRR
jgi:formylglycine-generating enzyme required for sulfatase activity